MSKTIPFKLSKTSNLISQDSITLTTNNALLHITDNEIRIKNNNNEIIINENGMNINNILHIKEQTITNVDSNTNIANITKQEDSNDNVESSKQEDSNQQESNGRNTQNYYIDDDGYLQGINILKNPIINLESTSSDDFQPKAIVLHRTDSSSAKSTLEHWKNNPYGTHFLIDTDGTIFQCASLYKYTQHVGRIKSKELELSKTNIDSYKGKTYKTVSDEEKKKSL